MEVPDAVSPPRDWLGGILRLELVVSSHRDAGVFLSHLTAYPTSFVLRAITLAREGPATACRQALDAAYELDEPGDLCLAHEIEFSDGRTAGLRSAWLTVGEEGDFARPSSLSSGQDEPRLAMTELAALDGEAEFRQDLWISPLPPSASVMFRANWPAAGIDVGEVEIDGEAIREAAHRARPIWGSEAG